MAIPAFSCNRAKKIDKCSAILAFGRCTPVVPCSFRPCTGERVQLNCLVACVCTGQLLFTKPVQDGSHHELLAHKWPCIHGASHDNGGFSSGHHILQHSVLSDRIHVYAVDMTGVEPFVRRCPSPGQLLRWRRQLFKCPSRVTVVQCLT